MKKWFALTKSIFLVSLTCITLLVTALDSTEARAASLNHVSHLLRTDPTGGTGGTAISGTLTVKVIQADTLQPISNAFVMVGSAPGVPFPSNYSYTNSSGLITFTHANLIGPVTITAGLANFEFFSLNNVNANDIILPLTPLPTTQTTYQVGDYVSGIDVNNGILHAGDGWVDVALVSQALTLDLVMNFNLDALIGPNEQMDILGNLVDVPSNLFIPQQWEIFTEINKDHYYLYLPPDNYTLHAISGRVEISVLIDFIQNGGALSDVIPLMQWKEIDKLDAVVLANTLSVDFTVDPDLTNTVTLTVANVPSGYAAYGLSLGDLDNLHGTGRLIMQGINSFSCESGPCGNTMTLSTVAASGEFSGMGYLPAVILNNNAESSTLAIIDRATHNRTYTATINSFFSPLSLTYANYIFSWNNVENASTGSPDVDIQIMHLRDSASNVCLWKFYTAGSQLSMQAPILPLSAPQPLISDQSYTWEHTSYALTYDLASFNFNQFAFNDILLHLSHLSFSSATFTFLVPTATPTITPTFTSTRTPTLTSTPNPQATVTITPSPTIPGTPSVIPVFSYPGLLIIVLMISLLFIKTNKKSAF